ncbi:cation diffusion family zinc membrane transporter Cis4 [Schizosaccharomyces cryophilus OY26]|uniref:Zinc transporter n=1 Tax=Schizosaccharomyces cryophilus (strain OY26 / ATCC MYA-4695 / CBS 11777 / NBRC 106824 / NRRL Y48691) TaxID=653667 RepID=S9VVW2_SCHCR|nr:cation diffusion family zinc membrane transporter Cis4 [Schizosaccharomyces cryophilus OY26]EPY50319.1 cation diffusion family zinc membrane transporter Cis4 [Schizosaccharomyces cryophilus OY26]
MMFSSKNHIEQDASTFAKKHDLRKFILNHSFVSSKLFGFTFILLYFVLLNLKIQKATIQVPFHLVFGIFLFISFVTQYLGVYSYSYQPFKIQNVFISAISMNLLTIGASNFGCLESLCLCVLSYKLFNHRSELSNPFRALTSLKNYLLIPLVCILFSLSSSLSAKPDSSVSTTLASILYVTFAVCMRAFYLESSKKQEKAGLKLILFSLLLCCFSQFGLLPLQSLDISMTPFALSSLISIFCMNYNDLDSMNYNLDFRDVRVLLAFGSVAAYHFVSNGLLKGIIIMYQLYFSYFHIGSEFTNTLKLPDNSRVVYVYNTFVVNGILADKESRSIFFFFLLNLFYMVVQVFYGFYTNSLGLISDAIHMAFDCIAVFVGLVATVLAKLPSNYAYPFGFAKVEALSGFTNGIFLILISFSIVCEAFYRLFHPPKMNTDQLLLVSFLGLIVNLVGIVAFNHGHAHNHGACSHFSKDLALPNNTNDVNIYEEFNNHHRDLRTHSIIDDYQDERKHEHSPILHDDLVHFDSQKEQKYLSHADHHSHSHHHHHHHHSENDNMQGIFLHILADTMGSVAVIVSTFLIKWFSWTGFDPLASIVTAVLIFFSVIPLIKNSAKNLLTVTDAESEYALKQCLSDISVMRSIISLSNPKFWNNEKGELHGTLHLQVSIEGDLNVTRDEIYRKLKSALPNLRDICIQVERPNTCWCGK